MLHLQLRPLILLDHLGEVGVHGPVRVRPDAAVQSTTAAPPGPKISTSARAAVGAAVADIDASLNRPTR
jgi:hypothetical protein